MAPVVDGETVPGEPELMATPPNAEGMSFTVAPTTTIAVSDEALAVGEEDSGALLINSLLLPLQENLVRTAPRPRTARRDPASLVPRRSDRLMAKSEFRDPNPEKQAKRVLVNKWERRPDERSVNRNNREPEPK